MYPKSFIQSVLLGLLASSSMVQAHTWIEQLMVIAPNGTMVGAPGFPRGNVLRSNPAFGDPAMVHLIPANGGANVVAPTDLMCRASQTQQQQTNGSPRLQAAPGAAVALRFQENGHVSLPDAQPGKPKNRGTVYVYGTTDPSPDDSFLAIHRVWNAAGTGGDGRGVLLSTRNFDDGQCYQVNGGPISAQRQKQFSHAFSMVMGNDLWCQQDIALPTNAPTGKPYTLYWVWDWPTMPGTPGLPQGKQEIYTTCMDIDIVGSSGVEPVSRAQGNSFIQNQPLDNAAIAAQLADITNPTAVVGEFIPFGASATGPIAGAAKTASASSENASGFLSVHTKSTEGPGVETTIIPIGASLPPAQQTQGQGGGRGQGSQEVSNAQPAQTAAPQTSAAAGNPQQPQTNNGNNGGGRGRGGRTRGGGDSGQQVAQTVNINTQPANSQVPATSQQVVNPAASEAASAVNSQSQQSAVQQSVAATNSNAQAPAVTASAERGGGRGNGGNSFVTVTEVDSIFETVFQTVYNTRFQKRAVVTKSASAPAPEKTTAAAAACSTEAKAYLLRARNPFYPFRVKSDTQAQSTGC